VDRVWIKQQRLNLFVNLLLAFGFLQKAKLCTTMVLQILDLFKIRSAGSSSL
jgi:hypothetical protein